MKATELKKFIKTAVREAIQDELKDILLEALKSSKGNVFESKQPNTPPITQNTTPNTSNSFDLRNKYMNALGETALNFTSQDAQPSFAPHNTDPVNGNLGSGEVSMDQIMNLMK